LHVPEAETWADFEGTGQLERRYYNASFLPMTDGQGQVTGLLNVAFDVTAQVAARQQVQELNEELASINEEMQATNEELNDANTRLLRTNADLDTFVYAASHDLKAPIANIEGLLNALRDYLPTEAQEPMVPRLVGMMEAAILRFQETVGHLTDILRQQHAPEQPGEIVDLTRVLEDVRLDLLPLLESTHAELLVDLANAPRVRLSTRSLRSVLFNLLSNAVKYRAPGRTPQVQIRTHCDDQQVILEVQDNGMVMSEL
jgi:signal transduction histidine kinase